MNLADAASTAARPLPLTVVLAWRRFPLASHQAVPSARLVLSACEVRDPILGAAPLENELSCIQGPACLADLNPSSGKGVMCTRCLSYSAGFGIVRISCGSPLQPSPLDVGCPSRSPGCLHAMQECLSQEELLPVVVALVLIIHSSISAAVLGDYTAGWWLR